MPMDVECDHRSRFFARDEDFVPCADCGREIVLRDIASERIRQMSSEGWTIAHDDDHGGGEMAAAAGCYALASAESEVGGLSPSDMIYGDEGQQTVPAHWPWDAKWWKPGNERRNLVRAAALIVAEIERLDRATSKQPS